MSLSRAAEAGSSNKFAAGFFFAGDSKAKLRPPARNFFHEEAPAKPEAGAAAEKPASNLPPPPDAAHRIDVNSATPEELLEVPGMTRPIAEAIVRGPTSGGLYESAEHIARVELGGNLGMIGKKRLANWLPWLVAVPSHLGGSIRVACWNLEHLADKSTVDKAVNFDCDKWLNTFARTLVRHCDLLVLLEVDNRTSDRLKERLMRHQLIGEHWRWLAGEAPVRSSEQRPDTAAGIAYLYRVNPSDAHPAVKLLSAPQTQVAEDSECHLIRQVPLFACGGFVVAPLVIQLTNCDTFERKALLDAKLPAVSNSAVRGALRAVWCRWCAKYATPGDGDRI